MNSEYPFLCYVDSGPRLLKYDSIPVTGTVTGTVTDDIASVTADPNLIQVQDRKNPQTSNVDAIQNTADDSIPVTGTVTGIVTVDIASVTTDPNLIEVQDRKNPQSSNIDAIQKSGNVSVTANPTLIQDQINSQPSNVDKSKKLIVDDLNRKISRCENNQILSELRKI